MNRFEAKQLSFGVLGLNPKLSWHVVDTLRGDEPLFGDHFPRDEEEARQCARAARAAESLVVEGIRRKLRELTFP